MVLSTHPETGLHPRLALILQSHHTLRNLGGVICAYVSGNRPTDLGPSCDPEVACDPALALLSHSLGAPGAKPVKLGLIQILKWPLGQAPPHSSL